MVYGSLEFIDIIIFAGIAIFLIYRLKNVLGKRGGFENKNLKDVENKKTDDNPSKAPLQLKENESKLSKVYDILPDFDHKVFLEGAKFAFETIINAFNKSDKKTLKSLLTNEVYNTFEQAINEEKNNPDFQFYSLTVQGVEEVNINKELISITLKIISEQFKESDESSVTKKEDTWTFQKTTDSNSPIWLLSAT
jgi:predicted lipid-binding transport protein (Tim44 family)